MLTYKAIEVFLASRTAKGDSLETVNWYRIIYSYFEVMFPELPADPESIDKFLLSCKHGDERRHGFYRALRVLYRFLRKRYKIENPVELVDPPRRSKKLPKALSIEDFLKVMNFKHDPRILAYLEFLSDTGSRIGELHNLKPENINHTPWGYIAKIHGKTGERYVPLLDSTCESIIKYIPVPFSLDYLGDLIRKAFKDARVKGSAHSLRHTFGTLWNGSEFALQDIMGHSNFEMLMNYRRLRTQKLSELHREFSPLLLTKNAVSTN